MAVYFMYMKTFGRANGSSAVSAAAYRAGERIRDDRTGRIYDHSAREGVLHTEIVLPAKLADSAPAWAEDRASLWNAAETAEPRKNARDAREFLVALPAEMSAEQRLRLVRGFATDLADRYGFALDLAVHAPRSDPRNHHAQLLATTREVGIEGLGAKTTLEISDVQRRARGLEPFFREVVLLRERWAIATNEALAAASIAVRVDHRSLEAQGIEREPQARLPRPAWEIERRGERSVIGDRIRAEQHARVDQRALAAQPEGLEDVRRRAREAWLELRRRSAAVAPDVARDRGSDDDLAR